MVHMEEEFFILQFTYFMVSNYLFFILKKLFAVLITAV